MEMLVALFEKALGRPLCEEERRLVASVFARRGKQNVGKGDNP